MNERLRNIIEKSTFTVKTGKYIYSKVRVPPSQVTDHFMISYDGDEMTVVTREENVKSLDLIERNRDLYRLFVLNVSVPFYSVGFLAHVSEAIARENINVLIVSTYSKDCLLISDTDSERVRNILINLGFKET